MGQVKPIFNIDEEEQDKLLSEILNLKLSSRQVEERVRNISGTNKKTSEEIIHYKNFFEDKTGSKVDIKKNKNKFKVTLNFSTADDLKDFINKIK